MVRLARATFVICVAALAACARPASRAAPSPPERLETLLGELADEVWKDAG